MTEAGDVRERAALISLIAQNISSELGNWLEHQCELGANEIPADASLWRADAVQPPQTDVQKKAVCAPTADRTPSPASNSAPLQPQRRESERYSEAKSAAALASASQKAQPQRGIAKSLASFQALRAAAAAPTYETAEERAMALDLLCGSARTCRLCPLGAKRADILWSSGPSDASLMFVAAGGNPRELDKGRIITDDAGVLFDKMIEAMASLHPEAKKDRIYIANVIKCACVPARERVMDIARACLNYLRREVRIVSPKVIVVWGEMAYRTMFGGDAKISQVRGQWQRFEGVPAIATHHPYELIKNPNKALRARVWADLQLAVEALKG